MFFVRQEPRFRISPLSIRIVRTYRILERYFRLSRRLAAAAISLATNPYFRINCSGVPDSAHVSWIPTNSMGQGVVSAATCAARTPRPLATQMFFGNYDGSGSRAARSSDFMEYMSMLRDRLEFLDVTRSFHRRPPT